MNLRGLVTYVRVLVAPRRAFSDLVVNPTWGWAALCGLGLTLAAVLLSERAQLHMMALMEAQRMAAMPPGERVREQIAAAQVASLRPTFLVIGALVAPWFVWLLIAIFFWIVALVSGARPKVSWAWTATLNSYAVYGVAGVINATLVALTDPATISRPTDLVLLPSPAMLAPHSQQLAAFLTAYNVGTLWYYVVVFIALETLLRMSRTAAVGVTIAYSLLFGVLAAFGGTSGH
ncbi:MAG: YIP1 family protein [Candidatus Eremiobacteraeota bacterium]|nr:YIP1 family protein [Candidatus Eremiobacteraeota bacterium]